MPRSSLLTAAVAASLMGALLTTAPPASAAPDRAQRAEQALRQAPHEVVLDDADALIVQDVVVDADGASHVRFDRTRRGVPVLGGDVVAHSAPDGSLTRVSATTRRELRVSLTPGVSREEAARTAFAAARNRPVRSSTPFLAIDSREEEQAQPRLVWSVTVFGTQEDSTPSELVTLVDAHSGRVVDAVETIETAGTDKGFYNGSVEVAATAVDGGFELRAPTTGGHFTTDMGGGTTGNGTLYRSADDIWGTDAPAEEVAVDAHFGAEKTLAYYASAHTRDGIDDAGYAGFSRVHNSVNYNNAFWSASCRCMTYGDGDGVTFGPFTQLDVAGHEMTHGITQATSNLTYSGESGGLNEASSDIFGTMVEFFSAGSTADRPDYLIGEHLRRGTREGQPLRYMDQPSKDGNSVDCWSKQVGRLDVHYSSGVANHFFFLLAEGSGAKSIDGVAYNSPTCNGATITGITRETAAAIWYRALTIEMTSRTNFAAARTATLAAAAFVAPGRKDVADAVAAAWSAVGVAAATTTKGRPGR